MDIKKESSVPPKKISSFPVGVPFTYGDNRKFSEIAKDKKFIRHYQTQKKIDITTNKRKKDLDFIGKIGTITGAILTLCFGFINAIGLIILAATILAIIGYGVKIYKKIF